MKIGIDISQAVFGTGVSDYTIDLVHAMRSVDPTNDYVLFGASLRRLPDLKKLFPAARLFHLPPMFLHYLWNYLHIVDVENLIGSVDVFHSSDWVQPPSKAPAVTTVHDLSPFLYPGEMQSGAFRNIARVHSSRMNWVVRECKKIICVSESTASELQQLFKVRSDSIVVIPEALPTRFRVHPTPHEISLVKKEYHLKKYILAIGTPQPRKNITRLVRSFIKYRDQYRLPDNLVIVGGYGWGITDIPADPGVIFTGYLPDIKVASLLAGAEVFAYPSLHEGFGLPILMGFFHQVPVVTSGISSMPEVAGNAAVLVDPKSEESIAVGLSRAVSDRKKLVPEGLQRLKNYTWSAAAGKTLMVYSWLC